MSKMISVASGFQYSVNIGFDLGNDEKLKNFIPTKSALSLLEEVLLSTAETSTERSRVLIGAYGKGKSHIVLTILSILLKRDLGLCFWYKMSIFLSRQLLLLANLITLNFLYNIAFVVGF